jgi:hypothetical protein
LLHELSLERSALGIRCFSLDKSPPTLSPSKDTALNPSHGPGAQP